jgi:hypothetical protein
LTPTPSPGSRGDDFARLIRGLVRVDLGDAYEDISAQA